MSESKFASKFELEKLDEKIKSYYLDGDCNCAETTLRVANEYFGLNLDEKALKLVGGFGGGMGRGDACGIICSGIAVLSALFIPDNGRAHAVKNFRSICRGWVNLFEEELGATPCAKLVAKYAKPNLRCFELVSRGIKLLIHYIENLDS